MRRLPLTRKKLVGFRCTEYQHPLFGKVWEFRQGQGGKHWETGPLPVGCRSQQRPVVHSEQKQLCSCSSNSQKTKKDTEALFSVLLITFQKNLSRLDLNCSFLPILTKSKLSKPPIFLELPLTKTS